MPTTSNCKGQTRFARTCDRRPDVCNSAAACNERGVTVDGSVPNPAVGVVLASARADQLAVERLAQLLQRGAIGPDGCGDGAHVVRVSARSDPLSSPGEAKCSHGLSRP